MATCPAGHESASTDFCDICGTRIDRPKVLDGRYTLGDVIGTGGMGQVFRAVTAEGSPVAVKVVYPALASDPEVIARFQRELQVLTSVNSPYVVRVLDLVADGTQLAIVMELVEGEDLRSLLARTGRLAPAEAVRLTIQVLRAAAAVHDAGVVHRDIKPENILLSGPADQRNVKLSDFGVAKVFSDSAPEITGENVIGTPAYIAPEVLSGSGQVSAAADLYSIGVVLYELLSGHQPFRSDTMHEAVARQLTQRPPRLADVSPPLWSALDSMLATDPAQRPSVMSAITLLEAASAVGEVASMQAPAAAAVGGPMPVFRRAVTAYRLPRSQASAPAGAPTPYPTGPPSPAWVPPAPAPAGWNPNPGPGASRATTASRPRLRTVTQLRVVRPAAPALLPGLRDAPGQRGYTVHPDRPITQDAPDPAMIRLDLGDHEFLIADFSGGARTLNWTTEVTPSEFIAIVDEYIATSPEPGRMSVSLNGLMEDVDPEFAVSLAVLSTGSFDKACDFARLDSGSFSMAFQVIPHDRRDDLRVFGLSAPDLDLTSVFPLIVRTGSRQAVAHALRLGPDSLTGRLARILAAGGTDAQPPQED